MEGYKVFNSDWTSQHGDLIFEVGMTYRTAGQPRLCEVGLHFCEKLADCFDYYHFDEKNHVCIIVATGDIDTDGEKSCTNKLTIVREVPWDEVEVMVNGGEGNIGLRNSGDKNIGNKNEGSENIGDGNAGDRNTGDRNAGNCNAGDRNLGDRNSGSRNAGNRNAGDSNDGNGNSGSRNAGSRNSGDDNGGGHNARNCNGGDRNAGAWNMGDGNAGSFNAGDRNAGSGNFGRCNAGDANRGCWNAGSGNAGDRNAGNRNSGSRNAGSHNIGDSNVGDWNAGSGAIGCFCTERNAGIAMFDQPSSWTMEDWLSSDARRVLEDLPHRVEVPTRTEGDLDSGSETGIPGPCRPDDATWDKFAQEWWDSLTYRAQESVLSLPNFDAQKFLACTGIDVNEPDPLDEGDYEDDPETLPDSADADPGDVDRRLSEAAESQSKEALEVLSEDADWRVRMAVAENEWTSTETLCKLADDVRTEVRRQIARAFDDEFNGLRHIAECEVGLTVLRKLAADCSFDVRYEVAGNPSLHEEDLLCLASDADCRIRMRVAGNPSAGIKVLSFLAFDEDVDVRWRVAENPRTPEDALVAVADRCSCDPAALGGLQAYKDTADLIMEHPNVTESAVRALARSEIVGVRRIVARDASAPETVLRCLAADRDPSVRWRVAKNPSTSEESLGMLTEDGDEDVRSSVVANPSAPLDLLLSLVKDRTMDVRLNIAGNPSAPVEVLRELAFDEERIRRRVAANVSAPDDVLRMLASSNVRDIRCNVAGNPSSPKDVLAALAADNSWHVRDCVARNTSAPPCVLLLLAVDLYTAVRVSASNNPSFPDADSAESAHCEDPGPAFDEAELAVELEELVSITLDGID